jgi:hypothetical protein
LEELEEMKFAGIWEWNLISLATSPDISAAWLVDEAEFSHRVMNRHFFHWNNPNLKVK